MKIIKYFFEFIFIYILLIIFKIIGYKNASNFGAIIGKKMCAFAGIGNPSNFFELLKENNLNLVKTFSYPDHHDYSYAEIENMENLQNKEIIAFAGIGNPSNFFDLLKENNLNLKKTYSFPDHHFYSQKDFDKIIRDNGTKIVTTEKDYYRMNDEQKKNCYCV